MKVLECLRCIGKINEIYNIKKKKERIPNDYLRYGTVDNYHAMILEMLGPSIEDLYNYCHRKFTIKTVLLLGEQMLERIFHIHCRSVIHRE